MITKLKYIKNIAVFKDFIWDTEVKCKENTVRELKKVNIIYGRNYSGKTTLSRILRAMEIGSISNKYENAECCVSLVDGTEITQHDFKAHDKSIRVFNEDFVKENLKFIVDPDESIQPFAILGGDNNKIEEEIEELKNKLGSNEEESESALYLELLNQQKVYKSASSTHSNAVNSLETQLSQKATNNPNGIKYKSEIYGDQNYSIRKLKADIDEVKKDTFVVITDERKDQLESLLQEKAKNNIPELKSIKLSFSTLSEKVKELISQKIGQADKIENLLKDAVLNRWVKEGKDLHENKLTNCAFCNNEITNDRWAELDRHFDEESDILEKELNQVLIKIENEKNLVQSTSGIKKEDFYSKFHTEIDELSIKNEDAIEKYIKSLDSLSTQVNVRKADLLNVKVFSNPTDFTSNINTIRDEFDALRIQSNDYTNNLSIEQSSAKELLRLREVHDFITDLNYDKLLVNIEALNSIVNKEKANRDIKQAEIDGIINQISAKQRELKDESKGADKVNEYLNNFFGHDFLTLKAIEFQDELTDNKKYKFEIHRNNKKAYHLSEGENSLVAFCYFMAKLQDIDTKNTKPIIWIDDPISSLDNNHIFFIYTLINTQIFQEREFEQLFISTHNLNFLKYLKRLPNAHNDKNRKEANKIYRYLIIQRNDDYSTISLMPNYIIDYVTEFNYLFEQIYKCVSMEKVDDDNYRTFYNFGNNARKFLEIYLYYKYPDASSEIDKMKKFFGDGNIPAVFTDRINNEYSHLSGIFERGQGPVEVPEMNKAAKLIITKIKEDEDQYNSLLISIGVELPVVDNAI